MPCPDTCPAALCLLFLCHQLCHNMERWPPHVRLMKPNHILLFTRLTLSLITDFLCFRKGPLPLWLVYWPLRTFKDVLYFYLSASLGKQLCLTWRQLLRSRLWQSLNLLFNTAPAFFLKVHEHQTPFSLIFVTLPFSPFSWFFTIRVDTGLNWI